MAPLQVNLLSNAVKFTDKGEVILQATAVSTRGKSVKVEFTCRGELSPFFSFKPSENCDCQHVVTVKGKVCNPLICPSLNLLERIP
jgi:hypothetical protein